MLNRDEQRSWVTQEQIEAAKRVDIVELIRALGYEVVRESTGRYRLKDDHSVDISNNMWHDHSKRIGGSTIDFIMKYDSHGACRFYDAVRRIHDLMHFSMNYDPVLPPPSVKKMKPQVEEDKADGKLVLPVKDVNNSRVIAYLTQTRGIDYCIVRSAIQQMHLYQSKIGGNCVFVGYDEKQSPRSAFLRGTSSTVKYVADAPGSKKEYGFCMEGQSEVAYVFESPIDALSYMSLLKEKGEDWSQDTFLSLGGLSSKALETYLNRNSTVRQIVLCLDNDDAGRQAAQAIEHKVGATFLSIHVRIQMPATKDFNDDLLHYREKTRAAKQIGHSISGPSL